MTSSSPATAADATVIGVSAAGDQPMPRPSPAMSIARGALALLSTQPFTWAATLATTIFLPRYLGDTGLGTYALAISVATLVAMVCSLGVPDYLARWLAAEPAAVREGGGALVLLTGVAILVGLPLAVMLPHVGIGTAQVAVLRVALASAVIIAGQNALLAVLRGQERHGHFAWLNASSVVLSAFLGIAVLALGGDLLAFMVCGVVVSAAVLVAGFRVAGVTLRRTAWSPRLWRRLAIGGLPFLTTTIVMWMYAQVDAVFLAVLSREAVLGWYSAAYRIISIPMFIPVLITTPLLPALSRAATDQEDFRRTLRRSFIAVLMLTVPASTMIIALAPVIPSVLHWPASFRHSVPLMMILAPHIPLVAADMVLASGIYALHRERDWLKMSVVAAVFNPIMNILLIPICDRALGNGAIGAAIATVATELLMFAGALLLMPSGTLGRGTTALSGRVLAAGAALIPAAAVAGQVFWPAAALAGGGVFVAVLFGLRVVRPAEVVHLARLAHASLERRRAGSAV